jgi:maltokinase
VITDGAQLAETIADRRWFGFKGRSIAGIDVLDEAVIEEAPTPLVLALVEVRLNDGGRALYHVPLVVTTDGHMRDAIEDPDRLRVLGKLMASGATVRSKRGAFRFEGPGLDPLAPPGGSSIRAVGAEQTHTSLILDEQIIVKLFRRVEIGPNPDLELNRLLTAAGFANVPPHVGGIFYTGAAATEASIDLAIGQQFVHDGQDGWRVTLREILRLYDAIDRADTPEDRPHLVEERAADTLESLEELGEVTASLHIALSREEADPEIAPEPVEVADLKAWAGTAYESLQRLSGRELEGIADLRAAAEASIDRLLTIGEGGAKMRVHGDYHLGQTLLSPRGWMIIDFEGEPARSLEDRRAKQSPLKDVGGMLRSFGYAASAALLERAEPDSDEWRRLEPWADTWETMARDAFLTAYLRRSHEGRWLPEERDALGAMLEVFELDKALYELEYELSHRPEWVRIPLRGLRRLLGRT